LFYEFGQCPAGSITLSTQDEVDDFVLAYPGCTALLGNLIIDGNDITNFKGLSGIISIDGSLRVRNTQILDFMGLEFLESVGGTFDLINNNALIALSGLDLLVSVNRFFVRQNTNLKSLDGMDSLAIIVEQESIIIVDNGSLISINALSTVVNCPNCSIEINSNPNLTNLEGLENIPHTDIFYLRFVDNPNLVVCNLQNICTFLSDGGDHMIENNASGCSSAAKILANCFFSISEVSIDSLLRLTPNPVSEILQIHTSEGVILQEATIYSILGEKLLTTSDKSIDVSSFSEGLYLVTVQTDRGTITRKIIKK